MQVKVQLPLSTPHIAPSNLDLDTRGSEWWISKFPSSGLLTHWERAHGRPWIWGRLDSEACLNAMKARKTFLDFEAFTLKWILFSGCWVVARFLFIWPVKLGPTGSPETSSVNLLRTLCKNRKSQDTENLLPPVIQIRLLQGRVCGLTHIPTTISRLQYKKITLK